MGRTLALLVMLVLLAPTPMSAASTGQSRSHSSAAIPSAAAPLKLPAVLPNRVVRVPILMYHFIDSAPPLTELNYGLTVTDASFTQQLSYLQAHGYHAILLPQLFAALYHGASLPSHAIILTFDDGYIDNYTDALPLLRKYHFQAEFNIISGYVGKKIGINSYMTWGQIKTLLKDGMEVGSHTVDHQDLGIMSETRARWELAYSRSVLQQKLGVTVQFLAYPSGEPFSSGTYAAQQEILSLLAKYGYVGALLDSPPYSSQQNARTPYQLYRIRVAGGEDLSQFIASLAD